METWLITGCSRGLGRSLAKYALEKGYNVVLTARKPETLHDLAAAYPAQTLAVPLDVTDFIDIQAAVRAAERKFGGVDVLVNNAGYAYRAAIEEGEWDKVEALYGTNLFGAQSALSVPSCRICALRKKGPSSISRPLLPSKRQSVPAFTPPPRPDWKG